MVRNGNTATTEKQLQWGTLFRSVDNSNIPDKIKKIYNNGVSDWIGKQPGDTKPILYVSSIAGSGDDWSEKTFEELTGISTRCFSYAYSGQSSPLYHNKHERYLNWFLKRGKRIFMDSGAHSLHRMLRSGKTLAHRIKLDKEDRKQFVEYITEEFLIRYANYIKQCYSEGKYFDFIVTLDSQKNCKLIYETTKRLEKLIGYPPIPVYHGDDSLNWIKRYIDDGHKLIGIGIDSKRIKGREARHRYYSEIHELTEKYGISTHGFALTGQRMFDYSWHCMTKAHEVLTKRGWMNYKDINKNDFVLTFKEGKSYWKRIKQIFKYKVKDIDIVKFSGKSIRSEVTKNHNWYVRTNSKKKDKKWKFINTNDLRTDYRIPRAAIYKNFPTQKLYSDTLIKLVAWVWTDGCITHSKNGNRLVRIYQSLKVNPEKCEEIQSLLNKLNIGFNLHLKKNGGLCFDLNNANMNVKAIVNILGWGKQLRFNFILKLTKIQLLNFIRCAVNGDGMFSKSIRKPRIKDKKKKFIFYQNISKSMEVFKMACILAGYSISSSTHTKTYESICASNYVVAKSPIKNYKSIKKYTGTIWCIEVENNTFMTRCKGSYYWTGNSVDSTTHLKAASFGKILSIIPERQRICQIHISERYSEMTAYGSFVLLSKQAQQGIINDIESNGFEFDKVRTSLNQRIMYNARVLQKAVELHTKNGFTLKGWEALV